MQLSCHLGLESLTVFTFAVKNIYSARLWAKRIESSGNKYIYRYLLNLQAQIAARAEEESTDIEQTYAARVLEERSHSGTPATSSLFAHLDQEVVGHVAHAFISVGMQYQQF